MRTSSSIDRSDPWWSALKHPGQLCVGCFCRALLTATTRLGRGCPWILGEEQRCDARDVGRSHGGTARHCVRGVADGGAAVGPAAGAVDVSARGKHLHTGALGDGGGVSSRRSDGKTVVSEKVAPAASCWLHRSDLAAAAEPKRSRKQKAALWRTQRICDRRLATYRVSPGVKRVHSGGGGHGCGRPGLRLLRWLLLRSKLLSIEAVPWRQVRSSCW